MSAPPINYNDATKLFTFAKDQNSYINYTLSTTTVQKEESASPELICLLAKVALEGLEQEIQKKLESPNKLRSQAEAVKDYLVKIKESSKSENLNDIFLKLFAEADTDLKQIDELDDYIGEQELKTFSDEKLLDISRDVSFYKNFEKYGIKGQKTKIRIAKLIAVRDGEWITTIIPFSGIKNEAALIEIAKLAAGENGAFVASHIGDYGITNQSGLIAIAEIIARQSGKALWELTDSIGKFGIKDQAALINIAKEVARKDGSTISSDIQRFKITEEKGLIEIAELAAGQNGTDTSKNILNYGITNQRALVNIAKLAAQQGGWGMSTHVQNYQIKDEDDRIEIAKTAARNDAMGLSKLIENYDISKKSGLLEIAKIVAQEDGEVISLYIHKFKVEKESDRIEIAKLAAQHNGWKVTEHIANYDIRNETALIEIAKLAVQNHALGTLVQFRNYDIRSESARFEIFLTAFKIAPDTTLSRMKNFNLLIPQIDQPHSPTLANIQNIVKWPEEFSPIFKELSQGTPDINDLYFLIYIGYKMRQKSSDLKDAKVWASIFQYKDQKMRYELADLAFALTEKQVKLYEQYSTPSHLRLPALIFCSTYQKDEDPKTYHSLLAAKKEFKEGILQKILLDTLHLLIIQNRFDTVESINLLQKALSENVKSILFCIQGILYCGGQDILKKVAQEKNPNLDDAYQAAFSRAVPMKPIKNFAKKYEQTFGTCVLPTAPLTYAGKLRQLSRMEQESALPCLGGFIHSVLENEYKEKRYKGSEHLEKIFTKQPSLRSSWPKDVVDVPLEKYLETSASKVEFDPETFLLEKILQHKHLSKKKHADLYQFLGAKDDKTAEEIGLSLNKKIIEIADADKKSKVQTKPIENALAIIKDLKEKPFGQQLKALKQAGKKIKGLPGIAENLDRIEKLSEANRRQPKIEDLEQAKIVEELISQFTKVSEEALRQLTLKEEVRQEWKLLQQQKDLIDLYKSKPPLSQQLNLLGKIHDNLSPSEEFHNDVKGLLETLTKQKESSEGYTLINTDRYDYMFLSGTQIQGSCQRIDGQPSLNKCLLAYPVDGKNRIIAILDKKGNIVARSILRLLWDKKKECPALMQEDIYSNLGDEGMSKALDSFAIDQAKRLGISLYKSSDEGLAELESYGGPAPWEYVDSAGGIKADSKFTITAASEVYNHQVT